MPYAGEPERGSRRRRLAAMAGTMAGSVYRAGVAAASEIREQYNNSGSGLDGNEAGSDGWYDDGPPDIPGAFPDVDFAVAGDAQMVLFPTYSTRHVRKYSQEGGSDPPAPRNWHDEFARLEDRKAVVDVNVHGWIYVPQKGPLSRKNRLLVGLARRLSGIPAAAATASATATAATASIGADDLGDFLRISHEAAAIEKRGMGEKEAAARGDYSESAQAAARYDDEVVGSQEGGGGGMRARSSRPSTPALGTSGPRPGSLTPRSSWGTSAASATSAATATATTTELTEAELAEANATLMARLSPFLTTPVALQPVTLFFYNETQSQSRTTTTTDAGHFSACVPLEFVPTHVRVLVSAGVALADSGGGGGGNGSNTPAVARLADPLAAVAKVELVADAGVSLISDIDDTVKTSNIGLGAREIFRNTFVRPLADMPVEGTRDWYGRLRALGVQFHYCSNSPWQLYPMLACFVRTAGLPPGSLHLKQYSGMLQGIFEPVAERKRGTLERILRDFPHRRFLLVGDSGEADLEVYTDLVLAHPGRVLAIFIRDVTTVLAAAAPPKSSLPPAAAAAAARPGLPSRAVSTPPAPANGPVMGTLIDLGDDDGSATTTAPVPPSSLDIMRKPVPPPRPAKPMALRSSMAMPATMAATPATSAESARSLPPPPPPPRRGTGGGGGFSGPGTSSGTPPRAPARAINNSPGTPSPDTSTSAPPQLPPRRAQSWETPSAAAAAGAPPTQPNRKVEMWERRLAHAQDLLMRQGVALYTWRRGQDVVEEAVGIVETVLGRR